MNRIWGSIFGLTVGDALGAHVEFRPRAFLEANRVTDLRGGGTWGLKKGQVQLLGNFLMQYAFGYPVVSYVLIMY